jgi:DNA repair photolyase
MSRVLLPGQSDGQRGRGAAVNPASRFETISLARLPEGGGDDDLLCEYSSDEEGDAPSRSRFRSIMTQVFRDRTKTIINPVDSPDLSFKWTINPYRGCEHGCFYCYARPTHELLGLSSGLDFETKIFAKTDAPELLRRELSHSKWVGESIVMSGVTDAYQPIERRMGITRACLEVMAECGQPVAIVTKSALVLRDVDLLSRLAQVGAARVAISLTTLDAELSAKMEPRASSPQRRLHAIRELTHAGVPVAVMTAPMIPGLNDRELPALLRAAARAGATGAGYVMLRLPWQNKAIFLEWLARHMPERAKHIENLLRDVRDGELNSSKFGQRMRGEGVIADQIRSVFEVFSRRYGLSSERIPLSSAAFRRPIVPDDSGQLRLFS